MRAWGIGPDMVGENGLRGWRGELEGYIPQEGDGTAKRLRPYGVFRASLVDSRHVRLTHDMTLRSRLSPASSLAIILVTPLVVAIQSLSRLQ